MTEIPDVEPYPSELEKIKEAATVLQSRFLGKTFDEATRKHFEVEARNRFEDVGFVVDIEWEDYGGITAPTFSFVRRVHKESYLDHDRVQHEITHGVADGQAGYIREDGTQHEDPIKKNIY